jgi:hypothetical protein
MMSLTDPPKKKKDMWVLTAQNPATVVVYNSMRVESGLVGDNMTE